MQKKVTSRRSAKRLRELRLFPNPHINHLSNVELLLGFEIERRKITIASEAK